MSQRGYVLLRKMARRVKEGKDWTTTSIQQYYTVSRLRQKMSLFTLVVTHVVNRKYKWLGPFLALFYTMSVVVGPLKNKRNRTEPNRTEPNRTEPNRTRLSVGFSFGFVVGFSVGVSAKSAKWSTFQRVRRACAHVCWYHVTTFIIVWCHVNFLSYLRLLRQTVERKHASSLHQTVTLRTNVRI